MEEITWKRTWKPLHYNEVYIGVLAGNAIYRHHIGIIISSSLLTRSQLWCYQPIGNLSSGAFTCNTESMMTSPHHPTSKMPAPYVGFQ